MSRCYVAGSVSELKTRNFKVESPSAIDRIVLPAFALFFSSHFVHRFVSINSTRTVPHNATYAALFPPSVVELMIRLFDTTNSCPVCGRLIRVLQNEFDLAGALLTCGQMQSELGISVRRERTVCVRNEVGIRVTLLRMELTPRS